MTTRRLQLALLAAVLSFGAQTSPSPTPRALLERGALAEEHQRDFAGAEKLYEQAEAAAKAAGDTKTATEAAAARQRVLARQGKAAPGQAERDAAVREQLQQRATEILNSLDESGTPEDVLAQRTQSLADLGPSVVGVLTQSLTGVPHDRVAFAVQHRPRVAARALARMEAEVADQALVRAYESPDPTIRKAVVQAARESRFVELQLRAAKDRFVELQLRAAEDSVASIREMASASLLLSTDARAAAYLETLARTGTGSGSGAALKWLSKHAPERCLAIAEDPDLNLTARAEALDELRNASPNPELLPRLLSLARTLRDQNERLRDLTWQVVGAVKLEDEAERAEALAAVEPQLLAFDSTEDDLIAARQLVEWGSSKSYDALRAAIARRPSGASHDDQGSLANLALKLIGKEVGSGRFEQWASLAVAPSSEWTVFVHRGHNKKLASILLSELASSRREVPLDQWIAFWPRVPAHHQLDYADQVGQRLRDLTKNQAQFQLPDDAAPLLRYMLASKSRDVVQTAVDVITLVKRIDLLEDTVRIADASSASLGNVAWQLHELDGARAIDAVRRRLSEVVQSQQLDPNGERALEMIFGLPTAEGLQLWRELWARASAAARAPLLRPLVSRAERSPETAALLVDLYPDIERVSSNLSVGALRAFGNALTEGSLPILERELRNPNGFVRGAALEVAEQFRKHREAVAEFDAWRKVVTVEQSTVADLAKLLESDNRDVLLGAVRALGILRARPALPALVKLLERKDPELQTAVKAAIDAIGSN